MFTAYDKNGQIIYAEDCEKGVDCVCKVCGEKLVLKKGDIKRPHFAHNTKGTCSYDDRDNKSPWHIRMQEYFPKEDREILFIDKRTGEKHIADVYLADKNTVIEFQHSDIKREEFLKRTEFHISNNRRIVWVFDESVKKPLENDLGKLRPDDFFVRPKPYGNLSYLWRGGTYNSIQNGPTITIGRNWLDYSVCIYSGTEDGDYLHRIVDVEEMGDKVYVTLSDNTILMKEEMNVDEFFLGEEHFLLNQEFQWVVSQFNWRKKGQDRPSFKENRVYDSLNH